MKPQFFDIFGCIGFVYVIILSVFAVSGAKTSRWMFVILFLVGIIGFLVDGSIVYVSYLR